MITRLNHAVLWVRDAQRSADFYESVLGFERIAEVGNGSGVFLRGAESDNHHDLGLFSVGAGDTAPTRAPGLYHLAWEVGTIDELVEVRAALVEAGALAGESDHGVSKSLYAKDPDDIEFEVLWTVPREDWGSFADDAVTRPLDLDASLRQYTSR